MTLIGFSGKKGAGKDTAANIVHDLCKDRYKVFKLPFALALKKEVAAATGHTVEYIDKHKECFRLILQGWGTDFRRNLYGQDYWIDKFSKAVTTIMLECPNALILIPDVRFENEATCIKELCGKLIRIYNHSGTQRPDLHPSEVEMDQYKDFDYFIPNTGTVVDLGVHVNTFLKKQNIL